MINALIGILMQMLATVNPCQLEDSNNCYWDASTSGNGVGDSWTSVQIGDTACISYWDKPENDYCEEVK